jgi:hypothetical protein
MRDDALPIGRLVLAGVAVAATVALAVIVVLTMLAHRHVPVGGLAIDKPVQPEAGRPALESAPQPDLAAYRSAKRQALEASDASGISIETAMALQAASAASSGTSR